MEEDLSDSKYEIAVGPVADEDLTKLNFDAKRALEDEDYRRQAAAMQGLDYENIPHLRPSTVGVIEEKFDERTLPPMNSDEAFRVTRSEGPLYEIIRVQANGVFTYERGTVEEGFRMRGGPQEIQGERITGQWNSELTRNIWEDLRTLEDGGELIGPVKNEKGEPDENLKEPIDYEAWAVGDEVESSRQPLKERVELVQRNPFYKEEHEADYNVELPQGSYYPNASFLPLQTVIGMGRESEEVLEEGGVETEQVDLGNSLKYQE